MAWSKSANRLTAKPTAVATPTPASAALSAIFPNASAFDGAAAFVRSSTEAFAFDIPDTKPWTLACSTTETTFVTTPPNVYAFVYAMGYDRRMVKEPMKSRVIRVPDKLWRAAQVRADERDETV